MLGKKANSFTESDGSFITKPSDTANNFKTFLIGKISKFRHAATNDKRTYASKYPSKIDQIMKDKHCRVQCGC
jgi:hypothetical protein